MLQKQFFRAQFQSPSQQVKYNQSRQNNTPSFSPKVQYANQSRKPLNSPRYTQSRQNPQLKPKPPSHPYQQSSQSYQSYYQQKINITNSLSAQQSNHSKQSRTQRSKKNMKALQEIKQEQENIQKLKVKYSTLMKEEGSRQSSAYEQFEEKRGNKFLSSRVLGPSQNSQSYDKKLGRNYIKPNRHLKTETSRQRNLHTHATNINQQSSACQNVSNSHNNTRSINNSFNPRFYNNQQSQQQSHRMMSPSQEYYSDSYQNQGSNNYQNQQGLSNQLQVINQRYAPYQSRDASTVNTQHQRASSLSLNKFAKKQMLTFYHCQAKKFYQYNDQGYLTDREIALREKVQKAAQQAIDRLIIQQQQQDLTQKTVKKSQSLGNFPKLHKLKEQTDRQRKVRFQLYGKYQNTISKQTDSNTGQYNQVSKEKSQIPSQLPPSSSLSKKRFNVIYKGENQNILQKNLVDDSYHQRQEKQRQSHIQQFTENARSSIIKKSKQKKSKLSHMSSQKQQQSSIEYQMLDSNKKPQMNQQSPKGISKIGGIASQYMMSSKKDVQSEVNQSKGSGNRLNRSKPSFVEEFSESSISDVKASSKNSIKQKKQESMKSSEQQSGKSSQQSQNLQMINSNYKKVTLTDLQLKISQNSSLKLKTNTDKDKKNLATQTQNIKVKPKQQPSISSEQQQHFQSSDQQFANKQSSNSVKSSHIGLTKQPFKRKKSKGSKLSSYGSESGIDGKLRKKESGHKWIRESEVIGESGQVNMMSKKERVQVGESTVRKQNDWNEEGEKNVRLSVESNCLKLDSLVNIPNKTNTHNPKSHQNGSKISQNQNQSNHTSSYNSQNQHKKSKNNKYLPSSFPQKPITYSSGQLLQQQSIQNIKSSMEMSKQSKKSKLSMQRESERSKMTKMSNRSNSNRLSIKADNKDMNALVQKYGNYLKVDNRQINKCKSLNCDNSQLIAQEQVDNNNNSKQSVHSDLQQQYRTKSHHSHSQNNASSAYNPSQPSQQSFTHSHSFNLTQRAQQLLQIQQNLHQKRRNLQTQFNMTEEFQQLLAKIQAHISIIKEILYIATNAIDIYSEDSPWVFKSCLLSLKKYHLERVKVVTSLRRKKSCFNIAENQLAEQDLKQFYSHQEIILLAKDFQYCNQLNQKMIQDFVSYLRQYFGQDFSQSQFNLRPFDDRFDLGLLLEEYRTQILGLREKASPSLSPQKGGQGQHQQENDQQVMEQETQETIKTRIFKLMEVSFLLSELAGKRIKEFTQEIDIQDDFDQYFSDYWPYFERIVKTFS